MNRVLRTDSSCFILRDFPFMKLLKSCEFLSVLILLSCQLHHNYKSLSLATTTEFLALQTSINCSTVIRVKRTRVETSVYFFPRIFDSFHFVHLLRLFHELLFPDVDTTFWTFEVKGVVDISTHTLLTTRVYQNTHSLQAVLTRCQPKLGVLEERYALVVAIITYNDRLHDNCLTGNKYREIVATEMRGILVFVIDVKYRSLRPVHSFPK